MSDPKPMTLWEIQRLLVDTNSDSWTKIGRATYDAVWDQLWVLNSDVSISIVYGAEHNGGAGWTHEAWSKVFADPMVYGYWAEIRYNGQTVHSDLILSVDGGRANLPTGRLLPGATGQVVTQQAYMFARLIDQLQDHDDEDFERYVAQANITQE